MSKHIPKVTVPRPLSEIQAEYNEFRVKAADSQYQIFVYKRALSEFNERMLELNEEGAARIELDKKSAAEAAAPAAEVKAEEPSSEA